MAAWTPEEWIVLSLGLWQVYGLFFLLGSLTVATLSDLRRLAAQSEFREVWALFALAMLGYDLYVLDGRPDLALGVKWCLIVLLSVLSSEHVGWIFRLASADVMACAAVASILSPLLVALFWVALKVAWFLERPFLPRRGNAYPFLPIVSTAAVAVLAVGMSAEAWLNAP